AEQARKPTPARPARGVRRGTAHSGCSLDLDLPTRCASVLLTGSERGGRHRFDLGIGADGLHSAVRRLTDREKSGVLSILSAPMRRSCWQKDIFIGMRASRSGVHSKPGAGKPRPDLEWTPNDRSPCFTPIPTMIPQHRSKVGPISSRAATGIRT